MNRVIEKILPGHLHRAVFITAVYLWLASSTLTIGAEPAARWRNISRQRFSDGVAAISLEYTVLRLKDRKEQAVHPRDYQFDVGDQIALRILPKDDVYLYIFSQGPTGEKECLWPTDKDVQKPAKRNQVFEEIPVFHINPPPGEEKLILVATIEPSKDLAGLTDRVFKKLDKELSAAERARKKELLEKTDDRLQGIQRLNQKSETLSAIPTPDAITQFNATVKATKHGNILELPAGKETSTFAMTVADKGLGKPALFEVILLKTVDREAAPQ